jgi:putative NIF3 family GTP cyclohydrolase 1 type 2
MTIQEIITEIENFAPLAYQEDYDNCGLITGQKDQTITGALLSLDCTEDVIEEAIKNNFN